MGRLIDADALIEQIWEKHKKVEESYDLCADELKEVFCGIVALVDEQPTAYDPDKVVTQLEERSKEYNAGVRLHGKPEEMLTDEAIEIVEGGGVDA